MGKGGRDSEKSVDCSDTDTLSPGESIGKAIVSLRTPDVLSNEAIQVISPKKFDCQSDCIISNPRIFKGEAIHVLLRQKFLINKAIVSLQTSEAFSDVAIQLLLFEVIVSLQNLRGLQEAKPPPLPAAS